MRRIGILAFIVGMWLVSTAWAQQHATKPSIGRHLAHRMANQAPRTPDLTARRSFHAQGNPDHASKIWELGTYPGGTWAALGGINDFGLAIGFGDVPPIGDDGVGYTHTLAISLFGPRAGEWIDLGTLGGELSRGWEEPYWFGISNTGLVATHSTAPDGQVHAVAWTKRSGMVDLGTLADTGDPRYVGHNSSYASGTNKLGTLIVGWSGVDGGCDVPVVWSSSQDRNNGGFLTKWQIHALDTKGFPDHLCWEPEPVNDQGQIVALVFDQDFTFIISVLWNPRRDGKGWKPIPLPYDPEYPYTLGFGIDNKGNIVGTVQSADGIIWLPRLWKPLNSKRTKYSQPIELALPTGFNYCEAAGINDIGDILGDCWDDPYTMDLPSRWTTRDPTFSEILNFPAVWGLAGGVNDFRIATVTYVSDLDGKCAWDTYGSCGGAILLH